MYLPDIVSMSCSERFTECFHISQRCTSIQEIFTLNVILEQLVRWRHFICSRNSFSHISAIYQSRWFQCELLSCGDKRLQRCEYNRKRWQRFQPYHHAERSYTFKGALRHNFLQFKCINHILFAVCERIVT